MARGRKELAAMSQVLVDIGGTSIRIGWQSKKAQDIRDSVTYACRDFATPVDALRQYCDQNQLKVDSVVLAVAAEVSGLEVDITNNHWIFNAGDLAQELGANEYLLINDFTAQAFSSSALLSPKPSINPQHHILLRKGVQTAGSPLLVTGPGTGLGVAALLPSNSGPMVIEGEGGHVSFAPRDEGERNILAVLAANLATCLRRGW
jgi:glucokinase